MVSTITLTPPTGPLTGRVTLPGSKSLTNRALLIAGLARGPSKLTGALKSDDTGHMGTALRAMGVTIDEPADTTFTVLAAGHLKEPAAPLFLGNAGTATRFLTAAATLVSGEVIVDGDEHMRKRPIGPLVAALANAGVNIEASTGCPPVRIHGTGAWSKRQVAIDAGLSSQYLSALLMAAACQPASTAIVLANHDIGARGYIALTLDVMRAFGATVKTVGGTYSVAPTGYQARDYAIEPDASAATYFWAAEKLTGGKLDGGLDPVRTAQPDGASWAVMQKFPDLPAEIDGRQMQDAIPTLAVLAAFADHPVRFTGIENLRVKECDRTAALCTGLNMIAPGLAREEDDDLIVNGGTNLTKAVRPALIDTHDDHRIAMSFALAGLRLPDIAIANPACVAKTFPGYWDALRSLGVKAT